ncbi:hypothetical protein Z517_11090 [Fonsecaea pedrosoi CBS 271.37]|uniref:BTB domain-containing protein n=1 Tax=Fonsecaea pedrosoi CBS 271.37 TaxID=1442368 RepID=A0A0D2GVD7_9EURO|nr:uncharacterized protein Z517_11090 [Fonsecaea pedrosoi CBS 271.37]KIW76344.1 hypothetical protein Z517_11090 [Fonsecaea pedrosoi CBS 271.37]
MDIAYESFVDSEPFKFLVGPTAKPFYMHGGLATKLSDPMAALLGGGMVEAKNRYAVLKDADEDTFVRVIQFAYTGDYAVAEPKSDSVPSTADNDDDIPPEAPEETVSYEDYSAAEPAQSWDFPSGGFSRKKKGRKNNAFFAEAFEDPGSLNERSKGKQAWDSFKTKAHLKETMCWDPEVNEDQHQNYTSVFLCHAKLYTFADQYLIEPLRELVLQKLRLTLSRFKLHQQRVGDVVELLKYTYANTPCRDPKIDQLRDLISDYLVCHIEKIVHHEEFFKLLDNGDVAKDFLPKLVALRLD